MHYFYLLLESNSLKIFFNKNSSEIPLVIYINLYLNILTIFLTSVSLTKGSSSSPIPHVY